MKQSEGQLLATNAYALLTSDYFSFSKTQCAVFKGTDRAVFLDKREFTGPIYTQIGEAVDFVLRNIRLGATIDVWLFEYDGEVDLGNATTDEVAQVAWMNREQIKELFDANMFVDTLEYFFTEVDK